MENNLFLNKYLNKINQLQLSRKKLLYVSNYRYFIIWKGWGRLQQQKKSALDIQNNDLELFSILKYKMFLIYDIHLPIFRLAPVSFWYAILISLSISFFLAQDVPGLILQLPCPSSGISYFSPLI